MHAAHKEKATYNSEEVVIVLLTNTIVKPSAVVIETIHTSIALATVL